MDALWAKDVFVAVENGVNTAIRKLRQALRDAPDRPDRSTPRRSQMLVLSMDPS